eukprot:4192676-Prymnesium_polylepis.2
MAKDKRYADFLAQTHWVPMLSLWRGQCAWSRFDTCVIILGLAPSAAILGALMGMAFAWNDLSQIYAPACVAFGSKHDCHFLALALEFVYISLLVVSAELGARLRVFILPTGAGPVFGTRLWDVEGLAQDLVGAPRRSSVTRPAAAGAALV